MKVRAIRSAIEGLDDDADVVLALDCRGDVGRYDEIRVVLDRAEEGTGTRPGLVIMAHAYDPDEGDGEAG